MNEVKNSDYKNKFVPGDKVIVRTTIPRTAEFTATVSSLAEHTDNGATYVFVRAVTSRAATAAAAKNNVGFNGWVPAAWLEKVPAAEAATATTVAAQSTNTTSTTTAATKTTTIKEYHDLSSDIAQAAEEQSAAWNKQQRAQEKAVATADVVATKNDDDDEGQADENEPEPRKPVIDNNDQHQNHGRHREKEQQKDVEPPARAESVERQRSTSRGFHSSSSDDDDHVGENGDTKARRVKKGKAVERHDENDDDDKNGNTGRSYSISRSRSYSNSSSSSSARRSNSAAMNRGGDGDGDNNGESSRERSHSVAFSDAAASASAGGTRRSLFRNNGSRSTEPTSLLFRGDRRVSSRSSFSSRGNNNNNMGVKPKKGKLAAERDTDYPVSIVYLGFEVCKLLKTAWAAVLDFQPPTGGVLHSIHLCHRCLAPMPRQKLLDSHLLVCNAFDVPDSAVDVFTSDTGDTTVFRIDGALEPEFALRLAILGRCFIEEKDLWDTAIQEIEFFALYGSAPRLGLRGAPGNAGSGFDPLWMKNCYAPDPDSIPYHGNNPHLYRQPSASSVAFSKTAAHYKPKRQPLYFAGYFSRVKGTPDHALSCIMLLPCFQGRGLGQLLVNLAYALDSCRIIQCGCEQCGSLPGQIAQPWSHAGKKLLCAHFNERLREGVKRVMQTDEDRAAAAGRNSARYRHFVSADEEEYAAVAAAIAREQQSSSSSLSSAAAVAAAMPVLPASLARQAHELLHRADLPPLRFGSSASNNNNNASQATAQQRTNGGSSNSSVVSGVAPSSIGASSSAAPCMFLELFRDDRAERKREKERRRKEEQEQQEKQQQQQATAGGKKASGSRRQRENDQVVPPPSAGSSGGSNSNNNRDYNHSIVRGYCALPKPLPWEALANKLTPSVHPDDAFDFLKEQRLLAQFALRQDDLKAEDRTIGVVFLPRSVLDEGKEQRAQQQEVLASARAKQDAAALARRSQRKNSGGNSLLSLPVSVPQPLTEREFLAQQIDNENRALRDPTHAYDKYTVAMFHAK